MYETRDRPADGYRYIPAVFQYSAGVAALPGFRIERIRFAEPATSPAVEAATPAPLVATTVTNPAPAPGTT